jgi:peptide-methionine (R)-S-oxide reductase
MHSDKKSVVKNELCPLPKHPKGMPKTEDEWKKVLTPEQYKVLREKGTEWAFSGTYVDNHEPGVYHCAACGAVLFQSDDKFDSGTGWPSFIRPAPDNNVGFREDNDHGMRRTEVYCKVCGGHLGHVFDDGPKPTGQRFCINSAALEFKKK